MGVHRSANATVAAHGAVLVTPNDTTIIPTPRSLYIGTTGNLTVRMGDFINGGLGDNILFTNVPVGIFPIQVDRVYTTGTTAAGIVALY